MKILIDEDLDIRLRHLFPDYETYTVDYMGWKGLSNGAMLDKPQPVRSPTRVGPPDGGGRRSDEYSPVRSTVLAGAYSYGTWKSGRRRRVGLLCGRAATDPATELIPRDQPPANRSSR